MNSNSGKIAYEIAELLKSGEYSFATVPAIDFAWYVLQETKSVSNTIPAMTVVPQDPVITRDSLNTWQWEYQPFVWVRMKFPPFVSDDTDRTLIDSMSLLFEQIADRLRHHKIATTESNYEWNCTKVSFDPMFDLDMLDGHRIFSGYITTTYIGNGNE